MVAPGGDLMVLVTLRRGCALLTASPTPLGSTQLKRRVKSIRRTHPSIHPRPDTARPLGISKCPLMNHSPTTDAKRILIHRLGSLGDTIVALPCLHLIERSFPNAERRLLTNFPVAGKAAPAQAVVGDSGLVNGYFAYEVGLRSPQRLLKLVFDIRRWGPQTAVSLMSARGPKAAKRDAAFFRACGIRQVFGLPTDPKMYERLTVGPDQFQEHEADRLARCLSDLGDARVEDPASWDLRLTASEKATADRALESAGNGPIIGLSLGTKNLSNEWGDDNWKALLGQLAAEYDGTLLLLGAESEAKRTQAVAELWEQKRGAKSIVNLCGKLQPRDSAAVLKRAGMFLGHDSGPIHLAAVVQTPCVGIYSSRQLPGAWFPYGRQHKILYRPVDCMGCQLVVCIEQKQKCIRSFTPDDVMERVRQILGGRRLATESNSA